MVSLLIRNVDPALHARLKARAAAYRRSLEEEARSLLRICLARQEAAPGQSDLLALARTLFGEEHGIDLELPPRDRDMDRPPPEFGSRAGTL
jgi:plasmid stability protein